MNLKNTVVSTGLLCLLQIGYADANDQRMPTVDELAKRTCLPGRRNGLGDLREIS
jgi:hypothetical protein